ncbi:hypothetical protein NM208_g11136 [Fusarium decemcellulare]|uniref:Uncharacterized protein n=1 Tax=Fusarium decemcellulare TaxID=57161 RepID=A0ACC1RVE2_9HYPO|nr:hypothetical protein NM208_g11136 [Fusarium decemcellulare]
MPGPHRRHLRPRVAFPPRVYRCRALPIPSRRVLALLTRSGHAARDRAFAVTLRRCDNIFPVHVIEVFDLNYARQRVVTAEDMRQFALMRENRGGVFNFTVFNREPFAVVSIIVCQILGVEDLNLYFDSEH